MYNVNHAHVYIKNYCIFYSILYIHIVTIIFLYMLFSLFLSRSSEPGAMVCPTIGNHHRKSNSLDAGMGKQTKQQSSRDR